jgi:hypothetical protein
MRACAVFALATILGTTEAQALDCEVLRTTRAPFEVTYRLTRNMKDGKPGTSVTIPSQVFRRTPDETVTYRITGFGQISQARTRHDLFPLDESVPGRGNRHWSYSIDTATDPLITRQPLSYRAESRAEDGKVDTSADVTLAFGDSANLEIEGCRFDLIKVMRTAVGTAAGKPLRYTAELGLSPELHVALLTRVETDDSTITSTATTIALEFQRFDRTR